MKYLLVVLALTAGCNTDLLTKQMATDALKNDRSVDIVNGYLDLRYAENRGSAFSMFEDLPAYVRRPLLIGLALMQCLIIGAFLVYQRKRSFLFLLPFILIMAGGIGNLVDRIRFDYVVDFIYFHIEDDFHWPIFNVADILITAGIILLLMQMLFAKNEQHPLALN
jgi:signal peptidase II